MFVLASLFWGSTAIGQTSESASRIKSDERVLFFPTAARLSDDGTTWIVPIHGWIFEPEKDDLLRRAAVWRIRDVLGLDADEPATPIFDRRVGWFLVDNERGKRIGIRIAGQACTLAASGADGHFAGIVHVPVESVGGVRTSGRLPFKAITQSGDDREFRSMAHLVSPSGISVISDIDDTIKISEVADKKKLLLNTFFRPYRAAPGMAKVYREWAEKGVQFHFVSCSPYQLYEPLSQFAAEAGFPAATYHLKRFRLKDSTFLKLFADPVETKVKTIATLLRRYPKRKFILVGDSGEKDPEAYGILARRHPDQVVRIYIRDVSGESADAPRYLDAFMSVPADRWAVFRDPATLRLPNSD
ncbi:MAG: DUF2183 domain-containing protein [Planctomycetes bacterium]|nr:DUF2183 domain-containing protein [Planctomycetota bacterium]